jgi:hypothetical protein
VTHDKNGFACRFEKSRNLNHVFESVKKLESKGAYSRNTPEHLIMTTRFGAVHFYKLFFGQLEIKQLQCHK